MSKAFWEKTNFNVGEVSPRMLGRSELPKYEAGCSEIYNMTCQIFGGLTRRIGTRYVARTKDQTSVRLIPFIFSTTQAYMLEFGDEYMRVYRNGGQVLDDGTNLITNGTFTGAITGWTDVSAGGNSVTHSSNTALFNVSDANSLCAITQAVTVKDYASFKLQFDATSTGTFTVRVTKTTGGAVIFERTYTNTTGTKEVFFGDNETSDITIRFSSNTNGAALDNVVLFQTYELTTPYAVEDLDLIKFTQSADTLYVVHPDYAPRQITRTDHDAWTISNFGFIRGPFKKQNEDRTLTLQASATSGTGVTVTASAATFHSDMVGGFIRLDLPAGHNNYPLWTASTVYGANTRVRNDDGVYLTSAGGTSKQVSPSHLNGTHNDGGPAGGGVDWTYENDGWGYAQIASFVDSEEVTADVLIKLPAPVASTATSYWRLGAWNGYEGFPHCVTFHEQRLFFASTYGQPQTIWASKPNDFINFEEGPESDDSINITLDDDKVNAIKWMVSGKKLAIGTSGAEYNVETREGDQPDIAQRESTIGSNDISQVVKINQSILFITKAETRLVEWVYDFDTDGYIGQDLSQLAEHFAYTYGRFKYLTWCKEPDAVVWIMTDTGKLVGCTYDRVQQVVGWHHHELGGSNSEVMSISSIPRASDNQDELWLAVKRGSVITIEYLAQRQEQENEKTDLCFLDNASAISNSTASTSVTNLRRYEGTEVSVWGDGSYLGEYTVSSGAITLDKAITTGFVGYKYTSRIKTLPISLPKGSPVSIHSKRKRILRAIVKVWRSLGFKIGPDTSNLNYIPFRDSSVLLGSSPNLYTGDKESILKSNIDSEARIVIEVDQPTPLTVLSIACDIDVGGY